MRAAAPDRRPHTAPDLLRSPTHAHANTMRSPSSRLTDAQVAPRPGDGHTLTDLSPVATIDAETRPAGDVNTSLHALVGVGVGVGVLVYDVLGRIRRTGVASMATLWPLCWLWSRAETTKARRVPLLATSNL